MRESNQVERERGYWVKALGNNKRDSSLAMFEGTFRETHLQMFTKINILIVTVINTCAEIHIDILTICTFICK